MMNDLATILSLSHENVRTLGQTVFVGAWGIHAGLTGNVQARNMHDSAMRFGLGTCNDTPETLAAAFSEGMEMMAKVGW